MVLHLFFIFLLLTEAGKYAIIEHVRESFVMKKMLFIYNPRAGRGRVRDELADILDMPIDKIIIVTRM